MKEIDNLINRRIARYRTLAGYTQETAAEALGLNKNTYARIERYGNPKPELLKKISELYGVSVQVILYGEVIATLTPEEPDEVMRFNSPPKEYEMEPPLTLTVNERNCIKACRKLPRDKRNELLKYINNFYNKYKED